MKVIPGVVKGGFGVATANLRHVMPLIEERSGLGPLVPGTFNVGIECHYIVLADAQIEMNEYNKLEFIKLQRCRIEGVRALIMRPNTHELGDAHGAIHLELLSTVKLRDHLNVKDGDSVSVEVEGDSEWWKP